MFFHLGPSIPVMPRLELPVRAGAVLEDDNFDRAGLGRECHSADLSQKDIGKLRVGMS